MMKAKVIIAVLMLMLIASPAYAQTNLTEEEKQEITEHAACRINDFISYLPEIAAKSNKPLGERKLAKKYITRALKLFIGEGEPYDWIDPAGVKRLHPAVTMQTTTTRGVKQRPRPMKQYLDRLMALPYHKVVFDTVQTVRVPGPFHPVAGNPDMYTAKAYFLQVFKAQTGDGRWKSDVTAKEVTIYVKKQPYPTPDGEHYRFLVMLGDISVISDFEYEKYE